MSTTKTKTASDLQPGDTIREECEAMYLTAKGFGPTFLKVDLWRVLEIRPERDANGEKRLRTVLSKVIQTGKFTGQVKGRQTRWYAPDRVLEVTA